MKTDGKEKEFDAVKMIRVIRDQLSREVMNMTHAQEKAYLKRLADTAKTSPRRE